MPPHDPVKSLGLVVHLKKIPLIKIWFIHSFFLEHIYCIKVHQYSSMTHHQWVSISTFFSTGHFLCCGDYQIAKKL